MGTKNNPGRFDCYANAAPDEPMFILLGRDKHAPTLVRLWAILRAAEGEDEAKVAEAHACAKAMEQHQLSLGKKPWGEHRSPLLEKVLIAATTELPDHPEGHECACNCAECRSYG
jgi:hypothetical protein